VLRNSRIKREPWRVTALDLLPHRVAGRDSDAAAAKLIDKCVSDLAYNIAYSYAWRNEADRAFEWLDKDVTVQDPRLSEVVFNLLCESIHDDPHRLPFLHEIGKTQEQLAAIKFEVQAPQQ